MLRSLVNREQMLYKMPDLWIDFLLKIYFFKIVCVSVYLSRVCALECRCLQKSEGGKLESQLAVSHSTWLLGPKLWFSARAMWVIHHEAVSLAPQPCLLKASKEQKHRQGRKQPWVHEVVCTALAPQCTDVWCDCRRPGTQSKWELYNIACQETWPYIKSRVARRKLLMT